MMRLPQAFAVSALIVSLHVLAPASALAELSGSVTHVRTVAGYEVSFTAVESVRHGPFQSSYEFEVSATPGPSQSNTGVRLRFESQSPSSVIETGDIRLGGPGLVGLERLRIRQDRRHPFEPDLISIRAGVCGNQTPELDEACDDGNQTNADECSNACEVVPAMHMLVVDDDSSIGEIYARGQEEIAVLGEKDESGRLVGVTTLRYSNGDLVANILMSEDGYPAGIVSGDLVLRFTNFDLANRKMDVSLLRPDGSFQTAAGLPFDDSLLAFVDAFGSGATAPLPSGVVAAGTDPDDTSYSRRVRVTGFFVTGIATTVASIVTVFTAGPAVTATAAAIGIVGSASLLVDGLVLTGILESKPTWLTVFDVGQCVAGPTAAKLICGVGVSFASAVGIIDGIDGTAAALSKLGAFVAMFFPNCESLDPAYSYDSRTDQPPQLRIEQPIEGFAISGIYTFVLMIRDECSGNDGATASVEIRPFDAVSGVAGTVVHRTSTLNASPYAWAVDTNQIPNGYYVAKAVAVDRLGQNTETLVYFFIQNEVTGVDCSDDNNAGMACIVPGTGEIGSCTSGTCAPEGAEGCCGQSPLPECDFQFGCSDPLPSICVDNNLGPGSWGRGTDSNGEECFVRL